MSKSNIVEEASEFDIEKVDATTNIDESDNYESNIINSNSLSKKALDATQLYLGEIGFSPLLSAEEEVYFSRLSLKGCEKSRKRMIESNLRLVVKI